MVSLSSILSRQNAERPASPRPQSPAGANRWRALLALAFIAIAPVVVASGRAEAPAQPAPVTRSVTDDLGTAMEVPIEPQRVLSVSLFSDEVVLSILEAERIAAVTRIAQNAIYSNVADLAAAIEPVIDFAAEQVIAVDPDLIVAADWSEPDVIAQLRAAGIPVYQVATPTTLAGIIAAIGDLGDLVGASEAADALISTIQTRVAALEARAAAIPMADRRDALDYSSWGTSNGADSTWQIVLNLAGVINAAAPYESDDFGQVPMSKELVVELDPDVLFVPGYIWGEEGAAEAFEAGVRSDPAFVDLTAVREGRVISFPENLKGTYSHFLIDAAELAASLVYPERGR